MSCQPLLPQHSHSICSSAAPLPSHASEFAQTGTCPTTRKPGCSEVLVVTLTVPQHQHAPLSLPERRGRQSAGHSLATPEHVSTGGQLQSFSLAVLSCIRAFSKPTTGSASRGSASSTVLLNRRVNNTNSRSAPPPCCRMVYGQIQ